MSPGRSVQAEHSMIASPKIETVEIEGVSDPIKPAESFLTVAHKGCL